MRGWSLTYTTLPARRYLSCHSSSVSFLLACSIVEARCSPLELCANPSTCIMFNSSFLDGSRITLFEVFWPALVCYWTVWIIYARFFHPLSDVPGPFWASISRMWIMYQTARGDAERTELAWHRKCGKVDWKFYEISDPW